jgi:hypothetical protein
MRLKKICKFVRPQFKEVQIYSYLSSNYEPEYQIMIRMEISFDSQNSGNPSFFLAAIQLIIASLAFFLFHAVTDRYSLLLV